MSAILGSSASSGSASRTDTLAHWLRLLFDRAPALHFDTDAPFIAAGAIHLPRRTHWQHASAAAAHAAAHLVYSPPMFDGTGLVPIARALAGLLEDARVETLAMRELPGLARLWRPLHTATPALGTDLEALLQRLARALADPAYEDPDAWVRKGRSLFFLDAALGLPALRTPAEVRRAAMLLGHDIGQMRLQLNAKSYRPAPAYRDDHRWMWAADLAEAAAPPAATSGGADRVDEDDPWSTDTDATVVRHPEWDRLILRLRPEWCSVIEQRASRFDDRRGDAPEPISERMESLPEAPLREPLRKLLRERGHCWLSDEGEAFDPVALVDWRIARRMRTSADARVYRGNDRRARRAAVWLLVDRSASSAAALSSASARGPTVLQAAAQAALATARALQAEGIDCAIAAFASNGRHAVRFGLVKSFDERAESIVAERLRALRPGGSTRLGAALRHAASRIESHAGAARCVIVFSDGEPHDVDMHDPRYLVEDARHAVRGAARRSVRIVCVALEKQRGADALRIFGHRGVGSLQEPRRLVAVFRNLFA